MSSVKTYLGSTLVLSSALVVAACGGSGSGSGGSISGTIRGQTYAVADTISSVTTSNGMSSGVIILSSASGICVDPTALVYHPGEQTLVIELQDRTGSVSTAPTAPGTYSIADSSTTNPPAKAAILYTTVLDATCANPGDSDTTGTSGTVTLTAVDGNAYSGTFDAMVESGDGTSIDHITGSFDAQACTQIQAQLASQTTPPCK